MEILRSLRHRNVVRYLGTSMDDCMVYIFMEFVSGGSLQSVLKRYIGVCVCVYVCVCVCVCVCMCVCVCVRAVSSTV